MKSFYFVFLILLFGLYAVLVVLYPEKERKEFFFRFPVVEEETKHSLGKAKFDGYDEGCFSIYYIGKVCDTIVLREQVKESQGIWTENGLFYMENSQSVLLRVDTTVMISKYAGFQKYVSAYPVFFVNTSQDTMCFHYGPLVPIILEALNDAGQWLVVRDYFQLVCGTGLESPLLCPNEMFVTAVEIFHGNERRKLRLRYKDTFSQVFYGSIDSASLKNARLFRSF